MPKEKPSTAGSSWSTSSSRSSLDDDFVDERSLQSPHNAASQPSGTFSMEPHRPKFSRYRSVRKANTVEPRGSQYGEPTVESGKPKTDEGLKKSMSRYKRVRPIQPPGSAAEPNKAGKEIDERGDAKGQRSKTQQEGNPAPLDSDTNVNSDMNRAQERTFESAMLSERIKRLSGGYERHAQPIISRDNRSSSPVKSPVDMYDSRPGTAKSSGADSWTSSFVDVQNTSLSRSTTSDWQAVSPVTTTSHKMSRSINGLEGSNYTNSHNIFIHIDKVPIEVSVNPTTTATDILAIATAKHPNVFDSSTATLAESLSKLGLERPIRHYELIQPILNSWDHETQHELLVLKPEEIGASRSASSSGARGLDIASAPSSRPEGFRCRLQHTNKPGRWSERTAILKPDGQVALASRPDAPPAEWMRIGHMTDFDAYIVTERRQRKLRSGRGERYMVAIKSLQRQALFEEQADYVHFFGSSDRDTVREWWEALRQWRSWYLVHEMGLGKLVSETKRNAKQPEVPARENSRDLQRSGTVRTTSGYQATGLNSPSRGNSASSQPQGSSGVSRSDTTRTRTKPPPQPLMGFTSSPPSATRPPRSPHSPQSPSSARSPRSSEDQSRGLIAHAQNADPFFHAGPQPSSSSHGLGAAHGDGLTSTIPGGSRTTSRSLRDARPLVDLTTESKFVKGSLLEGVERREEQERRSERARQEAWKARRT